MSFCPEKMDSGWCSHKASSLHDIALTCVCGWHDKPCSQSMISIISESVPQPMQRFPWCLRASRSRACSSDIQPLPLCTVASPESLACLMILCSLDDEIKSRIFILKLFHNLFSCCFLCSVKKNKLPQLWPGFSKHTFTYLFCSKLCLHPVTSPLKNHFHLKAICFVMFWWYDTLSRHVFKCVFLGPRQSPTFAVSWYDRGSSLAVICPDHDREAHGCELHTHSSVQILPAPLTLRLSWNELCSHPETQQYSL